jgi:predicted lactoylglutathione lyase
VEPDRATVCLPIKDRSASHAFYTALGFVAVGEAGDDGHLWQFTRADGVLIR